MGRTELEREQVSIAEALESRVAHFRMEARVKSALSVFEKGVVKGRQVNDLLGLRVVVPDEFGEEECYRISRAIADRSTMVRFKDYILAPKSNGYKSLHLMLQTACGANIEVQIRTERMHCVAEVGSAAHAVYKAQARGSADDERRQVVYATA